MMVLIFDMYMSIYEHTSTHIRHTVVHLVGGLAPLVIVLSHRLARSQALNAALRATIELLR